MATKTKKSSKNSKVRSSTFINTPKFLPSRRNALLFVALFALIGVAALVRSFADTGFSQTGGRPFAANSAWNTPIPANPKVDANSTAMVAAISSAQYPGGAQLYDYGFTVYWANSSTPKYNVNCTENWGNCALESQPVPIPDNAKPTPGSDGHMIVVDSAAGKSYEFWQYNFNNGKPQTSWGGVIDINGDGRGTSSVGAGTSGLGGLVRLADVNNGVIDHALSFASTTCAGPDNGSNFRYPATKTDGKYMGSDGLPEGARIQLDPSINVDALPGITPGEKMVAKALQKYGAYNVDCKGSGISMGFYFEDPREEGVTDPYPGIGFNWDSFGFTHIPWSSIRVLDASVTQPGGSSGTPAPTPPPTTPTTPTTPAPPTPTPPTPPSTGGDTQKPSAPGNLYASNVTATTAGLAWSTSTDNVAVKQYNVWRADSSGQWVQIATVGASPTITASFTDTTAVAGTTYRYGIRAQDAAGNISESSNIITVKTAASTPSTPTTPSNPAPVADSQAPSAPQSLHTTSVGSSSVALSWGASTDNVAVKQYNVWRTQGNSGKWQLLSTVTGSVTSYTDKTASGKTGYTYGIRAQDAAGNISDASNLILVNTPSTPWYHFWRWF